MYIICLDQFSFIVQKSVSQPNLSARLDVSVFLAHVSDILDIILYLILIVFETPWSPFTDRSWAISIT